MKVQWRTDPGWASVSTTQDVCVWLNHLALNLGPHPRPLIYPGARLPNHLHQEESFGITPLKSMECIRACPSPAQIKAPIIR